MFLRFGVVAAIAACAWAGTPAAGPRTGLLYDVTIQLADVNADLDALNADGYNITNVDGNVATLVTTSDELLWLYADGYDIATAEPQVLNRSSKRMGKALGTYHSYADLTTALQTYASAYPNICKLSSIGKSVQNRDIWAVKITDKPNKEENEPEFKYFSTMHGDEPVGTEMCLYFIDMLLTDYGTDTRITNLVDNTELWIVPLMNPDGLEAVTRFNANGIDLNRNFPTWPADFDGTVFDGAALNQSGRAAETQRVMEWTAQHSFVLAANFHTGARIVNYAFDDDNKGSGVNAPSPDDELFQDISLRYSESNSPMYNNSSPSTDAGIINGSKWYEITGGMQDWNYRYLGCNEVTIELSPTKTPNANQLAGLWDDNRESMLAYAESCHIGVAGVVKDKVSGDPVYAKISVVGNTHAVFTDPDVGDYHRMLLPGTYSLRISAPGYKTKRVSDVVVGTGEATRVNAKLKPVAIKTDINDDGKTNSVDLQRMVKALLTTTDDETCDVDANGVLDVSDLQLIVRTMRAPGSNPRTIRE